MRPSLQYAYYYKGGSSSPVEAPTVQANTLTIFNVTGTSLTVALVRGNGTGVLLLAKANAAISTFPADDTEYVDDPEYGSGDEIDGAFVVGNSTDADPEFDITNLTPGQDYHFRAFEYNV